jgi:hypothetical protein
MTLDDAETIGIRNNLPKADWSEALRDEQQTAHLFLIGRRESVFKADLLKQISLVFGLSAYLKGCAVRFKGFVHEAFV